MNKLSNGQKISKLLLPITFITLVILNVARFICLKYCLDWGWYQRILYDNLHHYQLGVFLLVVSFFFTRNLKRVRTLTYGIGLGLLLDELFFIVELFGIPPYFNESVSRWATFDAVAFLLIVFASRMWEEKDRFQVSISNPESRQS